MNNKKHTLIVNQDRFMGVYPNACLGLCMCFYEQVN